VANQYTTRDRREYQARLVEQWRSGGMTKKAFCETNDLAYHSAFRWTHRIAPGEETQKFVEIPAASATTSTTGIVVTGNSTARRREGGVDFLGIELRRQQRLPVLGLSALGEAKISAQIGHHYPDVSVGVHPLVHLGYHEGYILHCRHLRPVRSPAVKEGVAEGRTTISRLIGKSGDVEGFTVLF
jgi:hypothetical protein